MVPLTFGHGGTTVQASSPPLLVAEWGGPALVAVAVLVVIADLEREDSEILVPGPKESANYKKIKPLLDKTLQKKLLLA